MFKAAAAMLIILCCLPLMCLFVSVGWKMLTVDRHWQEVRSQGLADHKHEDIDLLRFISPVVGFAGASNWEKDAPKDSCDARPRIYKSSDGGLSWKRTYSSPAKGGRVRQIEHVQGILFALVSVRAEEENCRSNELSEIWTSEDEGDSWKMAYATQLPFQVRKILFRDKKHGFSIVQEQDAEEFLEETKDGGVSWSMVAPIDGISTYENMELFREGIVYQYSNCLCGKRKGSAEKENGIGYFDPSRKDTSLLLRTDDSLLMTTDSKGGLWALTKSDAWLSLLQIHDDGSIVSKPVGQEAVSGNPYSFHVEDGAVSLFVLGHTSIVGATHEFYRSTDAGATWKKEKIPFSLMAEPCAYFGKDHIWTDSYPGQLQIRKPR